MDLNDTTNPATEAEDVEAREVETPADEAEDTLEGEAESPDGEEAPPEEDEELDIDGEPLKVRKSVAEKLKARMMMQADYTQKTQAIAEQRREYEAQRQAFEQDQEYRQQLFREEAELHGVRERLQSYQGVNWSDIAMRDPQRAIAMQAEYTQLRDYHDRLSGHVEGRRAELAATREQETAAALSKAMEALNAPDPKLAWDGRFDSQKREALTKFGLEIGFTNEELANTSHPLMIKVLNMAYAHAKSLETQRKAPQRPAAEPAAKVPTAKARGYSVDPEKASMAQYAALARKAGRIK